MPKHVCLLAAVMLVNGAATAHSWYSEKCCHDKDCHPVPCEEIEKISDGWLWRDAATKQRHWFLHDRLKASYDNACHVSRHRRNRAVSASVPLPLSCSVKWPPKLTAAIKAAKKAGGPVARGIKSATGGVWYP